MARSVFLVLSVTCCFVVQARAEPKASGVKQTAQVIVQAVIKGDYGTVIDHTYPKAIEAMGGRDKAIAIVKHLMNQMKEKGIALKSVKVEEPGTFHTEGKNTFVVVPTKNEMSAPGGKIIGDSYLLGISSDGGKTWKFLDGQGLANKELRKKVLPKLPTKLKLPDPQTPEFVEDK